MWWRVRHQTQGRESRKLNETARAKQTNLILGFIRKTFSYLTFHSFYINKQFLFFFPFSFLHKNRQPKKSVTDTLVSNSFIFIFVEDEGRINQFWRRKCSFKFFFFQNQETPMWFFPFLSSFSGFCLGIWFLIYIYICCCCCQILSLHSKSFRHANQF